LNPVSVREAVEESGLLVGVDNTETANLVTGLNPAPEFNIDEGEISYESLFFEETSCPYYGFMSLPPELQDYKFSSSI
jgi:hypothetical protein